MILDLTLETIAAIRVALDKTAKATGDRRYQLALLAIHEQFNRDIPTATTVPMLLRKQAG